MQVACFSLLSPRPSCRAITLSPASPPSVVAVSATATVDLPLLASCTSAPSAAASTDTPTAAAAQARRATASRRLLDLRPWRTARRWMRRCNCTTTPLPPRPPSSRTACRRLATPSARAPARPTTRAAQAGAPAQREGQRRARGSRRRLSRSCRSVCRPCPTRRVCPSRCRRAMSECGAPVKAWACWRHGLNTIHRLTCPLPFASPQRHEPSHQRHGRQLAARRLLHRGVRGAPLFTFFSLCSHPLTLFAFSQPRRRADFSRLRPRASRAAVGQQPSRHRRHSAAPSLPAPAAFDLRPAPHPRRATHGSGRAARAGAQRSAMESERSTGRHSESARLHERRTCGGPAHCLDGQSGRGHGGHVGPSHSM
ncbi:hypothetical protein FA09DRAFT_116386 [Tilletiopsis washingtonensis]|uniref:Uncharacterized protein n=1 Tax=Tilletiopsis washingtonensis TaxID=58919 RepID=A0A316ZKF1_9BASI|nr:hypothetical protein FA09DRAFT_116386 [Tilletiopsis washingtonensis]PWO00856.1 hypothetical protein FA09DRAFT_116386 [Tilletiopsis washingtonensis]